MKLQEDFTRYLAPVFSKGLERLNQSYICGDLNIDLLVPAGNLCRRRRLHVSLMVAAGADGLRREILPWMLWPFHSMKRMILADHWVYLMACIFGTIALTRVTLLGAGKTKTTWQHVESYPPAIINSNMKSTRWQPRICCKVLPDSSIILMERISENRKNHDLWSAFRGFNRLINQQTGLLDNFYPQRLPPWKGCKYVERQRAQRILWSYLDGTR